MRLFTFRNVVVSTFVLTLILVMMGAWVRLTDAGLGCPDWPGCYGKFTPLHAAKDIAKAVVEQGGEHGPVSMGKAWNEMLHRYLASFVGFLILIMAAWSIFKPVAKIPALQNGGQRLGGQLPGADAKQGWGLPVVLLAVVIMQGMFGMWTVTLDLMPIIVTTHLLGGMITASLLVWLINRQFALPRYIDNEPVGRLKPLVIASMLAVMAQIFLGGWTSTNYAALACYDLPLCQGQVWPPSDFKLGFSLMRELGVDPAGNPITFPALTAIHLSHRIGAIFVFLIVAYTSLRVARAGERLLGRALAVMLLIQLLLGLSNVWFSLPIWVSVLHNGGAAVLLALLVTLNYRVYHARRRV
jgi:heme a synthase